MTTFARKALNALLPRGSAWAPKYAGGFDRLLDGVADCFEILRDAGSALAVLRHPLTTRQLEDLEREFGVLTELTLTDAERRTYLDGVVYGALGTGSEDNLEARLTAAGFTVSVWQNNPVIDPALLLSSTAVATCGCGVGCGSGGSCARSDDGHDSLLVNEEITRAPLNYTVPDNFRHWPFIFFVGGSVSGADFFDDWNMERPDTTAWTPGGDAVVTKTTLAHESGIRALKIAPGPTVDVADQQIHRVADDDLRSFYRMDNVGGLAINSAEWSVMVEDEDDFDDEPHYFTPEPPH
jgi:hypothetical protein